jgi:hypothetical protein
MSLQVRIVRRAEKAQDRIRFRIFSCQNRHEEAIEFGDLSDVSSSDSDAEDNEFGVMTIEEIQGKRTLVIVNLHPPLNLRAFCDQRHTRM